MLSAEGGVEFGGKLTVVYLGVLHSRGHCYSPGFFVTAFKLACSREELTVALV